MTSPRAARQSTCPPPRRWRGLLVLGLLAGLLGMHALAPAGLAPRQAQAVGTHARGMGTGVGMGMGMADAVLLSGEHAQGGSCGGCHVQHADPTCASGAVSTGPGAPSLAPDRTAAAAHADVPRPRAATDPDGGRAPPSLAELQVLRI
ncbi:DUF6153 family protein [Streptomyces sp. H51]|uniref:DUF6153 family protein n=1 Tax=Streptomyces sp. H51 TaxID=3111770 RepID=UPI002D78A9C6|nr:DUF6153 family protein [Streptomyces sp. H51]